MSWSFSANKAFRRCQRQWFYKNVFGNGNAKKVARREAYVLSKLQTIGAIRGNVVDETLSMRLIPSLNRGLIPNCDQLVAFALSMFDRRIEVMRTHPLERFVQNGESLPKDFVLLFDAEYGEGIDEEKIAVARSEIVKAIENLYKLDAIIDELRTARRIIAQRPLTYQLAGMSVKSVPDVIAFFPDKPPIVLDWKVHFFGNADAARQLASYAIALCEVHPHKDFPISTRGFPCQETRLWEVQLLTPELRKHEYDAEEYARLEEQIVLSAEEMCLALSGRRKPSDFLPEDFSPATDPRQCERCPFKRICWV